MDYFGVSKYYPRTHLHAAARLRPYGNGWNEEEIQTKNPYSLVNELRQGQKWPCFLLPNLISFVEQRLTTSSHMSVIKCLISCLLPILCSGQGLYKSIQVLNIEENPLAASFCSSCQV